jgi:hypothetical protein
MNGIRSEDEAARIILFSKYEEWANEREIRVLSSSPYYNNVQVTRVIAGHRMNDALFDTLYLVCENAGVDFRQVGIGDEGMDADRARPRLPARRDHR